ncbi:hypothetical protein M758_11G119800 [Ceratodon purpureus]|nr:hypothetical protein M758_11G119800 [Ceratodon purpureus]
MDDLKMRMDAKVNIVEAKVDRVEAKAKVEKYGGFSVEGLKYPMDHHKPMLIDSIKSPQEDDINARNRIIISQIALVRFLRFNKCYMPDACIFKYLNRGS